MENAHTTYFLDDVFRQIANRKWKISTNVFKLGRLQEEIAFFIKLGRNCFTNKATVSLLQWAVNWDWPCLWPFPWKLSVFQMETGPKHQEVDQPGWLTRAAQHAKVECSASLMSNRFSWNKSTLLDAVLLVYGKCKLLLQYMLGKM